MTKIKKNKTGNWDKKIAVACITKRSNHYRLTKCHFDIRTVKVCTKESRPNINGKLFLQKLRNETKSELSIFSEFETALEMTITYSDTRFLAI